MTDAHFVKRIEIYNFRCFDYLKVDNLKRVNLLGGDNNIGYSEFDVINYEKDNLKFETNIISINLKIKPSDQLSLFDHSDQNQQDGEIDESLFDYFI